MDNTDNLYDVAIVGSGPAGLSASIYASRYKLKNIVFGKLPGGTITEAHMVCNYPGLENISGIELGQKMLKQVQNLGAQYLPLSVVDVKKENEIFKILTDDQKEYFAKTIIFATGTDRNKLAIPKEDEYLGRGLSYCVTCDAMFYKEKVVAVIGGSSAATMAAVMLSDIAKKVYIIYRGTELRGDPTWAQQVLERNNIEVIYQTLVVDLQGEDRLERVKLSKAYKDSEYLDVDGIFVEIGSEPNISLPVKLNIKVDDHNYIVVDNQQQTSIEGIWAAGDCTTNSNYLKQVVTAVGEGAVAANSIYSYLNTKKTVSS
ncbi:MAG TPA: FAD-dependent oxidoreductase [Candidatus Dojkabacteria bacterium]|jgi:thioredoxin reductase (NADPH)|nr:FAD-dependent oxidoreductase [Candidatus Dojkabacteria bacterium]